MLDKDQAHEFYKLWVEFEERKTNEAKYASVFDRIEPILQNYKTKGITWSENKIDKEMVYQKNKHIKEGSKKMWEVFNEIMDECIKEGYI